jgi:hypothetical protein
MPRPLDRGIVRFASPTSGQLAVKIPTGEVPLPVLVAFLIAAQKTIAVGLPIDISGPEDRAVAGRPTLEEV